MPKETAKCGEFKRHVERFASMTPNLDVAVKCVNASTPEKCIEKIKNGDADLVTLDGGDVYTAGKLGILSSMIVCKRSWKPKRFYAKHHTIHCLETTLCFETTSRKASNFQRAFFFSS